MFVVACAGLGLAVASLPGVDSSGGLAHLIDFSWASAGKWLEAWIAVVRLADWGSIRDVRVTYPSTDPVNVASGRNVAVFNVCGNDYRLIVAIHYNKRRFTPWTS